MLPSAAYLLLSFFIFNVPDSPLILLGLIGAFIFGIGCFNIVAAFMQQYLGHKVTLICFSLGFILSIVSILIVAG